MAKRNFIQHVAYLDKKYVFQVTLNTTGYSKAMLIL